MTDAERRARDVEIARAYVKARGGTAIGACAWLEAGRIDPPPDLALLAAGELAAIELARMDEAAGSTRDEWGDTKEEARHRFVSTFGAPDEPKPPPPPKPKAKANPGAFKSHPGKAPPPREPMKKAGDDFYLPQGRGGAGGGIWCTAPHDTGRDLELERLHMGYSCPIAVMDERHGRRSQARNPFRWQRSDGRLE